MAPSPSDSAVLALWQLSVVFDAHLAAQLSTMDLSVAAFRLVGEVSRAPEGLRQGQLAKRLGVRPPTVSAAVARLEASGILRRVPDPDDPRARRVCMAPGADLQPGVDVLATIESRLLAGQTEEQRRATIDLLNALTRRLQEPT
jgi:DNA-binding MarR family transcriptional regulator